MSTVSFAERSASRVWTPGPRLIIAFSCTDPTRRVHRWSPRVIDLDHVTVVNIGRVQERFSLRADTVTGEASLSLPDRHMSGQHLRVFCTSAGWRVRDLDSSNGTFVGGQRISSAAAGVPLGDNDVIECGSVILVFRAASQVAYPLMEAMGSPLGTSGEEPASLSEFDTLNPALVHTFTALHTVVDSDVPIVLHGETGTGKEVIAHGIHRLSGRTGRLVAVNCGAIPRGLVESELFGSERGAFSGARRRPGLIRSAHGGTLFLDEIAELPGPSQAALLRVLQEKQVTPVGSVDAIDVDIRVVAASHQDLQARVEAGSFRRDLLARLSDVTVTLPPVHRRREDIGILISRILPACAGKRADKLRFSREAGGHLFRYRWPDNVRELYKVLRVAARRAVRGEIRRNHLPRKVLGPKTAARAAAPVVERVHIRARDPDAADKLRALGVTCGGNVSAMAKAMGTSRSQVRRLLRRFGVDITSG